MRQAWPAAACTRGASQALVGQKPIRPLRLETRRRVEACWTRRSVQNRPMPNRWCRSIYLVSFPRRMGQNSNRDKSEWDCQFGATRASHVCVIPLGQWARRALGPGPSICLPSNFSLGPECTLCHVVLARNIRVEPSQRIEPSRLGCSIRGYFFIGILLIPFSSRRNQHTSSHALRYNHFIIDQQHREQSNML